MQMVNLGLEVSPSLRLGMNSLNRGAVDTLFMARSQHLDKLLNIHINLE